MTKYVYKFLLVFVLSLFGCEDPTTFSVSEKSTHKFIDNLVYLAQFTDDSQELTVIDEKRNLYVWNLDTKQLIFSLAPSETPEELRAFFYKKVAGLLIIAGANYIDLWDVKQKSKLGRLKIESDEPLAKISALNLSRHAGLIAIGMTDGTLFVYNRSSNSSIKEQIHDSTINHLFFDDADRYVLSGGLDGKISKRAVSNLEIQYEKKFKTRLSSLAFNNESGLVFASDVLKEQVVFDFNSGERISHLDYSSRFRWFREALFLDDKKHLLTTTPKTDISIWSIKTGKELFTWSSKVLSLGSTTMDVKSDGEDIVTVTSEGVYQKWSLIKQ